MQVRSTTRGIERKQLAVLRPAQYSLASFSKVWALARDDVAYAASRIFDVMLAARDQVQVAVEDRLAGYFSVVDAHVEALDASVLPLELLGTRRG